MSLGAALRANSIANAGALHRDSKDAAASTPRAAAAAAAAGSTGAGTGIASPRAGEPKLHFFPLPAPPRWRRLETQGAELPACAGATLSALNHGHTLLLFGGLQGQIPAAAVAVTAAAAHQRAGSGLAGVQSVASNGINAAPTGGANPAPLPAQPPPHPQTALSSEMFLLDAATSRCVAMGARFGAESSHCCRTGHAAAALDEHTLLVSGGWSGRKYLASGLVVDLKNRQILFEHNNTTSNTAAPAAALAPRLLPPPRRDHALVRVGRRSVFLMFGWQGEECLGDVWVCRLVKTPAPAPAATSALAASSDQAVVAPASSGGSSGGSRWEWSPFALSAHISTPPPRRGASACALGRHVWVFGGLQGYSTYTNSLYILDTVTHSWSSPSPSSFAGTPPSPRAWHSCVALGRSGYLLVFGGVGPDRDAGAGAGPDSQFLNDLHLLDTRARRWFALVQSSVQSEERIAAAAAPGSKPQPPQPPVSDMPTPRSSHAACVVGSRLFIHGGLSPVSLANHATGGQTLSVRPVGDTYVLETFLPPEVLEGEGEEEEESDEDDGEEEDGEEEEEGAEEASPATAGAASATMRYTTSPTLAASSSPPHPGSTVHSPQQQGHSSRASVSPRMPGLAELSSAPSSSSLTEGWLALSTLGATGGSGGAAWSRRFVRLEKHTLQIHQAEGGHAAAAAAAVVLERDGVAKLWTDAHANLSHAAADGDAESLEWLQLQQQQTASASAPGPLSGKKGFTLKTHLSESDRGVSHCTHCQLKFTSRTTKHRSFCAYCAEVCCDRCTDNLATLPTALQRLLLPGTGTDAGGAAGTGAGSATGVTRVRVCDVCEHVLRTHSKAATGSAAAAHDLAGPSAAGGPAAPLSVEASFASRPARPWAFSYAAPSQAGPVQPVHLAAESYRSAAEWVAALQEGMRQQQQQMASGVGSGSGGASDRHSGSPDKGAAGGTAGAAPSSSTPVMREGWLLQEEGRGSKLYKRRYALLRGATLTLLDLPLKKAFPVRPDTIVQADPDQTNAAAAAAPARERERERERMQRGGGAGAAGLAGPLLSSDVEPDQWASLFPFSISNGVGEGGGASSSICFAAPSALERAHWMAQLGADVQGQQDAERGVGFGVGGAAAPGALSLATAMAPASSHPSAAAGAAGIGAGADAHRRFRSASTPFGLGLGLGAGGMAGAAVASGAGAGALGSSSSVSALSLLSSLAAQQEQQRAMAQHQWPPPAVGRPSSLPAHSPLQQHQQTTPPHN